MLLAVGRWTTLLSLKDQDLFAKVRIELPGGILGVPSRWRYSALPRPSGCPTDKR
jgi:hypothetical protein